MVDLHTHILPGIDDGARSWHEALDMARAAADDGITAMVATPHWHRGVYENGRKRILFMTEKLNELLDRHRIALQVLPGAELRIHPVIPHGIRSGRLMTLNDGRRYALVEFPPEVLPQNLNAFFFELQDLGVTPVIAHPERYPEVMRRPEHLTDWIRRGVILQITAQGLLGGMGKDIQRFTIHMLENGLAHVIASDSHGLRNRPPKLLEAFRFASEIVGEEAARELVLDIPGRLVKGEPYEPPAPPLQQRKPPLWRRLLRGRSR
jgi:protein-tyrosine phosphatase